MVHFLYLAHTKERYRKQTAFSILTLLEFLADSQSKHSIVVYTDDPDYFRQLPVQTIAVSEGLLREWKGEIAFVHRMKICLLMDAAERFSGPLILLDSDNCVFQDPLPLLTDWKDDLLFMSSLEYRLQHPADVVGRKYRRFFRRHSRFKGVSEEYVVTMQQECWNAGVVGLSEKATAYLPDVLALCDTIHSLFPKHLSEQMAFNIVMSRHFRLKGFSDVSYHWFGHGQAINHIIDRVLSNLHQDSLEELIIKVRAVKQEVLHAPLNPDKLPWYRKWFF